MAEPVPQGPPVPPPGRRTGTGSESLLPYLTPPKAPPLNDGAPAPDEPAGDPPGPGGPPPDAATRAATLPLVIGE